MTVKNVSNLAASVQARLQNHARATKRPFQELLQYYAMERFLYRLSTTPHRERFVLKGALMLHVWDAPLARATKDAARALNEARATPTRRDWEVATPTTSRALAGAAPRAAGAPAPSGPVSAASVPGGSVRVPLRIPFAYFCTNREQEHARIEDTGCLLEHRSGH